MEQINTTDVDVTDIGNLFRACGAGGDGTPLTADFMNGIMMELINVIKKSGQTPIAFNRNDPESYNQLYKAIQKLIQDATGGVKTDPDCAAKKLTFYKDGELLCTMFLEPLLGVVLTAPSTATSGQQGLAASVTDPTNGKDPIKYAWEFNGVSAGTTKSIAFNAPNQVGTYTLKCTVTDADGKTATVSQNVTVTKPCVTTTLWQGNVSSGLSDLTLELTESIESFSSIKVYGFANGNFVVSTPATVGAEARLDPNPNDFTDIVYVKITSENSVLLRWENVDFQGASDNFWQKIEGVC